MGALPHGKAGEHTFGRKGAGVSGRDVSSAQRVDAGFGGMLRAFRREAGFTHEELARRSQVSVRTISDIERGRVRRPHRRSVQQLAEALGLAASRLDRFLRAARTVPGDGPDRPQESRRETPATEPTYEAADEQQSAVVVMLLPLNAIGESAPCCRRRRRCPQARPTGLRHQTGARPAVPARVPQPRTG
ncbi:helix-turn-helix domain-containing protein [Kitasatospora sp. NPDC086791]|uniref:helix-turn-helix domain-containing protein n=1 Tax=Kitasatospora sp. NPDC086791 TaxID=3155178 RepID=UPI00341E0545